MKRNFGIFLFFLLLPGFLLAQDGLDFLDKVNEKPKSSSVKPKEEVGTSASKKNVQVTQANEVAKKKKKSKKKSQKLPDTNVVSNNNVSNQTLERAIQPSEKSIEAVEPEVTGVWLDSLPSPEPKGLPGFSQDIIRKDKQVVAELTGVKPSEKTGSFGISEFFDKYKKAFLIVGIIVLFAFYRLRSGRSSYSSGRSYRR